MNLTIIHSTLGCEDTACPTIYRDENGNYVIQGFKIPNKEKSELKLPQGEDVVVIPHNFLESFIEKVKP